MNKILIRVVVFLLAVSSLAVGAKPGQSSDKEGEEVCGYWFCGSSTQGNNGGGKEPQ